MHYFNVFTDKIQFLEKGFNIITDVTLMFYHRRIYQSVWKNCQCDKSPKLLIGYGNQRTYLKIYNIRTNCFGKFQLQKLKTAILSTKIYLTSRRTVFYSYSHRYPKSTIYVISFVLDLERMFPVFIATVLR